MVDNESFIKIYDFHNAQKLGEEEFLTGVPECQLEELNYCAPEMFDNSLYDKSADWWALGVLLY